MELIDSGAWSGSGVLGPEALPPRPFLDLFTEYGSQAVVWQTAVNPVAALELIDSGAWSGAGVLGPEALPPRPFLGLLNDYGSPWAIEERTPGAGLDL